MADRIRFLDDLLGPMFKAPKRRQKQDPGYGRLYRWCKKNGVSYTRDLSYWDFDDARIGTIGAADGGEDYDSVLDIAKTRLSK